MLPTTIWNRMCTLVNMPLWFWAVRWLHCDELRSRSNYNSNDLSVTPDPVASASCARDTTTGALRGRRPAKAPLSRSLISCSSVVRPPLKETQCAAPGQSATVRSQNQPHHRPPVPVCVCRGFDVQRINVEEREARRPFYVYRTCWEFFDPPRV